MAFDLSNALAKSEMAFAGKGEISPRAITMWDFSWLERRWPGAGYEDWDQVFTSLLSIWTGWLKTGKSCYSFSALY